MVQYVNVVSLPDLSVLISWRRPIQSLVTKTVYHVLILNESESNADREAPIIIPHNNTGPFPKNRTLTSYEQIRISSLKLGLLYELVILPRYLSVEIYSIGLE